MNAALKRLPDAELGAPAAAAAWNGVVKANRANRGHETNTDTVVGLELEGRVLPQSLHLINRVPRIPAVELENTLEIVVLADRNPQLGLEQGQVAAPEPVLVEAA